MASKNMFIMKMAKKGGITQAEATRMKNLFIETLLDCLIEDGKVKSMDFGKFELKTAKEKMGRNPKTGDIHMIPERKMVRFHASEGLAGRFKEMQREE